MNSHDWLLPTESQTPRSESRVWGGWASAAFGVTVIGAFFFINVLTIVAFIFGFRASDPILNLSHLTQKIIPRAGLVTAIATILSTIICIPLIALFVKLRHSTSFTEYVGLRRFRIKTLVFWLVITLGIIVLSESLNFLFKRPPNASDIHLYATSIWPPLLWIAFIIFAPAFEETFFRGFLFEGFSQSRVGATFTIVLMAVAWSSLHIPSDPFELSTIFVSGLVLGIARLKTNSLWIPISMHVFWNLIETVEIGILVFLGVVVLPGAPAHGEKIVLQAAFSNSNSSANQEMMVDMTGFIRSKLDELGKPNSGVEWNSTGQITIRVPKNTVAAVLEAVIKPDIIMFGELAGANETARWETQMGRWKPSTGIVNGQALELTSEYILGKTSVESKDSGGVSMIFQWDTTGSQLSRQITTRLIGKPLGIFEGDHALLGKYGVPIAPIVRGVISKNGSIDGIALDEARRLSTEINASRLLRVISVAEY